MSLPLPIKPIRVEVVGIHPQYARLLVLHMDLDQTPPMDWCACFDRAGAELPWIEMHPPLLQGSRILLHPTDADLEQEVAHVEERIRIANQRWLARISAEVPILPPQPQESAEEGMFSPEVRDRIHAARRRTEQMSQAFVAQGFWRSDAWVTEDLLALEAITQN